MRPLHLGELARLASAGLHTPALLRAKRAAAAAATPAVGLSPVSTRTGGVGQVQPRCGEARLFALASKESLALWYGLGVGCGGATVQAEYTAGEIDAKTSDLLLVVRDASTNLLEGRGGADPAIRCPIVESLAGNGQPGTDR